MRRFSKPILLGLVLLLRVPFACAEDTPNEVPMQAWQLAGIKSGFADTSEAVRGDILVLCIDYNWGSRLEPAQVVPLLNDNNHVVRRSAVEALAQMGKEGAGFAAQIVPLLNDNDFYVRQSAVWALAQMGKEGAAVAAQVVPLLNDKDSIVRSSAVEALGQMGKEGAAVAAQVLPLLQDKDSDVRSSAAEALGQMGKEGAAFAAQVVPLLKDDQVRLSAAKVLGQMGREGAAVAVQVVPLLKDNNPSVRSSAAEALGQMGKEGAAFAAQVLPLLQDKDSTVRSSAAEALGQMGKEGAAFAAQVEPLLQDKDSDVRSSAAEALGQMGKEGAAFAAQVEPQLQDKDSTVRSSAAKALGQMGKEGAAFAAQVEPLLKDNYSSVRLSATKALAQMGKEGAAVAAQVEPLLQDKDSTVRSSAAEALGQMGKEGAGFAAQVVPLLKDKDYDVRDSAAKALGQMGEEGAAFAAQLVPLLRDEDSAVHGFAAKVLDQFGNQSGREPDREVWLVSALEALMTISAAERPELRAHLRLWCGGHANLQLALDWLADPESEPMPEGGLSPEDLRETLTEFSALWDHAVQNPRVKAELTSRITEVVASVPAAQDAKLEEILRKLRTQTNSRREIQQAIDAALNRIETGKWLRRGSITVGIHLACWLLLLLAYPRWVWVQTFCFWNPWFRKFIGFPYVGLVLRYVPFARRRLFAPFADVLVADARLAQFANEEWFPDCTVRNLDADRRQQKSLRLSDAVPRLRGQIVLIGESGLGKTMCLRDVVKGAVRAGRIVAFLPAEDCKGGVLEALKNRLEGPAKDHAFLRDLVFAGAIDLGIDGLSQVPPDMRDKVSEFMREFPRANIMVTTQPMEWRAPLLARHFRLEPLASEKIRVFLQSREPLLAADAKLRGDGFRHACAKYVSEVLEAPNPDIAETDAAREVLSNPLDATVAAELLAGGVKPDLLDLRTQQYEAMAAEYRDEAGASFPLADMAEAAYGMRMAASEVFPAEEFPRELTYLAKHRLLMRKQSLIAGDGKKQEWWVFRHEKFNEFFVVHSFCGPNRARREQHLGDPPFRGVYLRLAQVLPMADAEDLREKFIRYAAETGDHSTSDEYIRILARRKALETGFGAP